MFREAAAAQCRFFADRHSSEFIARLTTGPPREPGAHLLITSIGRDFLLALGLAAVMAWQDPVMSLFRRRRGAAAMLVLRQADQAHQTIAHEQFTGKYPPARDAAETSRASAIVRRSRSRTVMRKRFDANITDLENESNKWAGSPIARAP